MKTIFSVILCSLFAINLSAKELSPRRTVVAGKIINRTSEDPNMLSVFFCDPLDDNYVGGTKLNGDGKFQAEYDMYLSQNITVKYANNFINIFINPSDSVYLEIDMSTFRNRDYDGLHFSGSGADINNEFAKFCNHLYSFPPAEIDPNLPPKEYMVKVKEAVQNQLDSIAPYIEQHNLPPFFAEWAKRDIIFSLANYNLSDYAPDNTTDRLTVYTDPFLDIYNTDNFQSMIYPYHLSFLMEAILETDARFREYLENGENEKAALLGLELLEKIPASLQRDFMTCMLIQRCSKECPNLYEKLPKNLFFDSYFDSQFMKPELPKTTFPVTPINGISYVDKDNKVSAIAEQDFLTYLASTYKGKVIYLDIYATWCGPCRKEFPYAKELHKLYPKDVVFVNLCLASSYEYWLPTVSELNIEGENYFFNADATDLFRATYKFSGYPTYAIIGKNGEVVTMNAPRPSNLAKLKSAIDAIL